ncbi:MAG: FAD:protein FMN transferase [Anaerolineae bacterium]|nr:FAD:protein FMN transferase [Thermoflexales bacterium]MDW8408568.1 FAD:protein FMN transferase [Anaerolineae bacterium]
MKQILFRAMGCQMQAIVDAHTSDAEEALQNVPVWFEIWEQCLSRFRPTSELSRLNAQAGRWVGVSQTVWAVLQAALETAEQSGGLVIPTVWSAMQAIGYTRPFDQMIGDVEVRMNEALSEEPANGRAGWRAIRLDAANRSVWLPPNTQLDLGGIAKGWCADQAARRLSVYGPALVDAGGDIAVVPGAGRSTAFPIGIAAPSGEDTTTESLIGIVMLTEGGIATSGRDYRRWRLGNGWAHHIIDPRTGKPADTDVLIATAIAATATRAEAIAKTALILGSRAGLEWVAAQGDSGALTVSEGRTVACTSNFPLQDVVAPATRSVSEGHTRPSLPMHRTHA